MFLGKHDDGYTLIELLIVISIVAILGAVAIPSYQFSIVGNRVSAQFDRLAMDMSYARSEAIKRGATVAICPKAGCVESSNWGQGWVVFLDPDNDFKGSTTESNVLKKENAFTGTDTLIPDASLGKGVSFNRNGYTYGSGKLTLKDSTDHVKARRCLVFSTGFWKRQIGEAC